MLVEDSTGTHQAPEWLREAATQNLRSYQRRWLLEAAHQDIAHRGARQLGKDWSWAWEVGLDIGCRPRRQWSILSASLSHSKDFLADVSRHLGFLERLHRWQGYSFPRKVKDSAEMIELDNGSSFRAYAATPKNAQGRRGNIILNEIGIMPQAELIYETAEAVVRGQRTQGLGAVMRIIGNASVRGSFFQRFWEGRQSSSFLKVTSTWEDAIAQWLTFDLGHSAEKARRWIALQVEEMIERLGIPAFGQWYRCEWRAPEEGFFAPEVLDRQQYDPEKAPTDFPDLHNPGVRQGVGWDPSRRRHPAGICQALEGKGGTFHYLHRPRRMQKWTWEAQEQELDRRIGERSTVRVAIDRQGIGDKPAEDAQKRHGDGLVYGYDFSPAKRMALLNHAQDALERGLLWLPINTDLRMEFEAIQRTFSERTGKEGAVIPEQGDTHGDMAVAAMLAEWALSHPGPAVFGGWA